MGGRLMADIRLKYVHAFIDRHGRPRFYFRRKGRQTPLPGLPGAEVFMDAYQRALTAGAPAGSPKGGAKSLSALFASYYASPSFSRLSPSSQRLYRQALKPIEAAHGHRGAVDLPDDKAHKLIEEIGTTRPGMANLTRSVLRRAFAHAVKPLKWRYTNPFSEIESYKVGTHHTWTDADFAAYRARWPLGSRERVAFDLLYYTGQRIGDVAGMRRADISEKGIYVKQEKTDVELHIPVHPGLRRSLNAYGIHGQHLIARIDGKKLSTKMLQVIVNDAIEAAGLPEGCVPHGIRKGVLRQLAEGGKSTKEIAALSGHKTLKEIERYTEAADQGRMVIAAINCLPDWSA